MQIGDFVGLCQFHATNNLQGKFEDFHGQWLILYFYPKDATAGCTTEGQNFRDMYTNFKELNAEVFGISRDSLKSHENFKTKQLFPFELISDVDEQLCNQFDVLKMKSMYGKQYRGIERSTFLINPEGIIQRVWRKVKVNGHVQAVYDALMQLHNN